MSRRYKGAVLSATPPTTSTSSASGIWTEQQFMQGVASGSWPALAGAPTIGTATAGALSASVTFTAPTYTGSGITGYTATSSPGGITGTGASSPVTVSGLTAGTAYTFTVTATTAAGQGSASAASNSVTPTAPNYIEDVYSTYLYTGTGATQNIVNGINLSANGGLVWMKTRSAAYSHFLADTARGVDEWLRSNTTNASANANDSIPAFNSNGFTVGSYPNTNDTGVTFTSWTFREQPKFFDVVTYTGNGSTSRAISHNLGSEPGCIIVKNISNGGVNWAVYHVSLGVTSNLVLNSTAAAAANGSGAVWGGSSLASPSSTTFTVGNGNGVNTNGDSYVVYLFANDAGGFGLTGTDNVISCGTYTGTGSPLNVTLGYEPQWLLVKKTSATGDWILMDTMRGMSMTTSQWLYPNAATVEDASGTQLNPTATGFTVSSTGSGLNGGGQTYIYIAIRRGPMAVPTSGTSVYQGVARTGTSANATVTGASFAPDLTVIAGQSNSSGKTWTDKLRGANKALLSVYTNAEQTTTDWVTGFTNTGFTLGADASGADYVNKSPKTYINWMFGRAPSFFDEVCYTGNGAGNNAQTHNLATAPELLIIKNRSAQGSGDWFTFHTFTVSNFKKQLLDTTDAQTNYSYGSFLDAQPTSTTFTVNSGAGCNNSGTTYVAYLFATCAGVSKVGSYTGNGTTQTIDCGFGAGGVRFVLIKRTDSTGDWYVYDTARGMTVLTDPYLLLNDGSPETATLGSVTTVSTGFALNSSILAAINVNGGTYIFLAVS
jgi:hypothetical protein